MMTENEIESDSRIWRKFLRNHWRMVILFVVGAALASLGAILVFLWFVGDAQSTGLVPSTLALWAMGYVWTFAWNLIFWELLIIGVPVILSIVLVYMLWWKRMPSDERDEYRRGKLFGSRSRKRDGSGGFSFLASIVFIIIVYLDGKWNTPFSTWSFDYLVYTWLWALIWVSIIVGIPMILGGTWWLHREIKNHP
jgi:hypothetical protein